MKYIKWTAQYLTPKDSMMNAHVPIAETDGELIYIQGTDIEGSSSNAKTCNNCNAQRYYKYYFENAYSI